MYCVLEDAPREFIQEMKYAYLAALEACGEEEVTGLDSLKFTEIDAVSCDALISDGFIFEYYDGMLFDTEEWRAC